MNAVAGGDKVQLVGFGTFRRFANAVREPAGIPAPRKPLSFPLPKQPVFKAGKSFKGRCGEVTRDAGKGRPDRAAFLLCKKGKEKGNASSTAGPFRLWKTHTVLARLEELARTEEPGLLVLLVPEQFSLKARGRCWSAWALVWPGL